MSMNQMRVFAKATAKKGEVYIYDAIGQTWDGGLTANTFKDIMAEVKGATELDVYFNSPGGNVFDGIAIYNQLDRHPATRKTAHVDGIAASIASVIMLACPERMIASNGTVMIHNPSGVCFGTSVDMRKTAQTLDEIRDTILGTYVKATGKAEKDLIAWMDDETWMNADQAIERGFATAKTDALEIKSLFPELKNYGKVPDYLKSQQSPDLKARMAAMSMDVMRIRGASPAKA